MYESLKAEVSRAKLEQNLTYQDLQKMTGFTANALAKFMCGKSNSLKIARSLARNLGICTITLGRTDTTRLLRIVGAADPELHAELLKQTEEVTSHDINTQL